MILHSMEVQGWRCFANRVKIGPLSERLNVFHAPNGTGKSTLLQAMMRAYFDSHRVTGRDIEAARPWGRQLAPEITIEFCCDGTEYSLEKRFLDGARSVLKRREGGRYVRLAEGDKADDHVRGLLLASVPGRGVSKYTHWGLAQILWVPQGEMGLKELSGDVVQGIQELLGTQVGGGQSSGVEQMIDELHATIYTPTGRLRGGKESPRIVTLERKITERQEETGAVRRQWERFEEASRQIQDLAAQREQARHDLGQIRTLVGETRTHVAAYEELDRKRELLEVQLEGVQAKERGIRERAARIKDLGEKAVRHRTRIGELEKDETALREELGACEKAVRDADAALVKVRGQREAVEQAREKAAAAHQFLELMAEIGGAESIHAKASRESTTHDSLRQKLAEFVAPEKKELARIRRAVEKRNSLQLQLDAALITLEIEPLADGTVQVLSAETMGKRSLVAGKCVELKGAPEVAVEFPRLVRIRARAVTESVPELRKKLERAAEKARDLTLPYGTSEIDLLEDLSYRRQKIESKLDKCEARLEAMLEGQPLEDLTSELAKNRASLKELLAGHKEWAKKDPDAENLERESKGFAQLHRSEEKTAERAMESSREAQEEISRRWNSHQEDLRACKRELKRAAEELDEAQSDGLDDTQRRRKLREARTDVDRLSETLEEVAEALAKYDSDPREDLEGLVQQLESQESGERTLLEQEKKQEGRLRELSASEPYAALARAEENLAQLQGEFQREQVRVDAIRLLHEMVSELRSEAIAAVGRPVEERASLIFHRIAGRRLGPIRLTEHFDPVSVLPESTEDSVELADLSGGEREQLHLAVRLALADVLGREERQLLVLDDVLTATDTPRLARVHRILEEAAEAHQIMILTCHPERYRGLKDAEFVDLRERLEV